jgi:hypothetical protein
LFAFPIFWLFGTRNPTIVTASIVVGICLCQGVVFALHASFMPELFGTNVRYSGVSLGFQLGAAKGREIGTGGSDKGSPDLSIAGLCCGWMRRRNAAPNKLEHDLRCRLISVNRVELNCHWALARWN